MATSTNCTKKIFWLTIFKNKNKITTRVVVIVHKTPTPPQTLAFEVLFFFSHHTQEEQKPSTHICCREFCFLQICTRTLLHWNASISLPNQSPPPHTTHHSVPPEQCMLGRHRQVMDGVGGQLSMLMPYLAKLIALKGSAGSSGAGLS